MFKSFCTFCCLFFGCLVSTLEAGFWVEDYQRAAKLSAESGKHILLFFNGSDWSGYGMKMKKEILDSPLFQQKLEDQCICVEIDFPEHKHLAEKLQKQNTLLKEKYHITEYPFIVLLDAHEREVLRLGYVQEGLEEGALKFATELLHIIATDNKLSSGLAHLDTLSSDALVDCYSMAQELADQGASDAVLAAGLRKDPQAFFRLEKYRHLVDEGKMVNDEAKKLRDELLALDPCNEKGVQYSLALIDFQGLSKTTTDPKVLAQPLEAFLSCFGHQKNVEVWRLEMLIAQVYLNYDRWESAFEHAQKAYLGAPSDVKSEISRSVDYIKSRLSPIANK